MLFIPVKMYRFNDTNNGKIKIELCKTIQPQIETRIGKPIRKLFLCKLNRIGFFIVL